MLTLTLSKKLSIFLLFLFTTAHTISLTAKPIIILNGSSSAGKSTTARHLLELLGPDFTVVSLDEFRKHYFGVQGIELQLVPADYQYRYHTLFFYDAKNYISTLDQPEKDAREKILNALWNSVDEKFYEHINALSEATGVIVDTIIIKDQQINVLREKLAADQLTTVFVHISFDDIIARIIKRNATNIIDEIRCLNRTLCFYPLFYKAAESDEETILDDRVDVEKIKNVVQAVQESGLALSSKFPQGSLLADKLIELFHLNELENANSYITLTPQFTYDIIVDTSKCSPEECAAIIQSSRSKDRV